MKRLLLPALALAGLLAAPAAANAASQAYATTDLNLRAGPSTAYPAVDVIRGGNPVRVFGCLAGRSWCDVGYRGVRGWASSNYLADDVRPRYRGPRAVQAIGAPIITFSVGSYWDNHYRGRGFYRERDRYARPGHRGRGPDRFDRRDDRFERGDRRDRRDDRGEGRDDRRGDRRGGDWQGDGRGPGREAPPQPLYRIN